MKSARSSPDAPTHRRLDSATATRDDSFRHEHRFIIHDHDKIFSAELNASLTHFGLTVITTPMRSPQANSLCERLIGTLRRECLDWIIPLSERHLRRDLTSWMSH